MRFSIIVVCLNPGDKLKATLDSVFMQSFTDYEIVLKDGGSKDGSVDAVRPLAEKYPLCIYEEKDKSIYDAMNQAVAYAKGEYVFFLNCGDSFYDSDVLKRVDEAAKAYEKESGTPKDQMRAIFYGDIFGEKNGVWITPSPEINGFTCYRNVPCHQACFYSTVLCKEKSFEIDYKIRGDYEHFLWCYYKGGATARYMKAPVANYEGGGYSETKENLKRSKREHKEITEKYMAKGELLRYKAIMWCTLAPLRTAMAESKHFSKLYNGMKSFVYGIRGKRS